MIAYIYMNVNEVGITKIFTFSEYSTSKASIRIQTQCVHIRHYPDCIKSVQLKCTHYNKHAKQEGK